MEHVDNFLEWLSENDQWLNLIFLVLAILSIVISIFLYKKSQRKKLPVFDKRSLNVISESIQSHGKIEVKYQGELVNNLTVSKVAFWNNGNETINSSDQAPTDKFRIKLLEEFNILNAELIYQSSATNNIQLIVVENEILISFDYLDKQHGGVIKFTHTGKKSNDFDVLGTFKGTGEIKSVNQNMVDVILTIALLSIPPIGIKSRSKKLFTRSLPWTLVATGIIFLLIPFIFDFNSSDSYFPYILGAIYFVTGLGAIFKGNNLPKGFEAFYDDE